MAQHESKADSSFFRDRLRSIVAACVMAVIIGFTVQGGGISATAQGPQPDPSPTPAGCVYEDGNEVPVCHPSDDNGDNVLNDILPGIFSLMGLS